MVRALGELIAREYPGDKENVAYKKIEEATGISLSTMQRIMGGGTGPSIDTLAVLAHHLGSTVANILDTTGDRAVVPFAQPRSNHPKRPTP